MPENKEIPTTIGKRKLQKTEVEVEVQGLASISKDVSESVIVMDRNEIRFLVDRYYQIQDIRKASANQIRAVKQGFDYGEGNDSNEESVIPTALEWLYLNQKNEEKQLQKMLKTYAENHPVGKWLMSIKGIGPVIAAGLISMFDVKKAKYVNNFWSYAGLNDNNNPWLGKVKSEKWVNEWLDEHPDEDPKNLTTQIVVDACIEFKRTYETSLKQAYVKVKGEFVTPLTITEKSVKAWLARPPYNTELKTLCWKIGESFLKVKNKPESLYGRLLNERYIYETQKNEAGEYAEEAAKALANKKWTKKDMKETYQSGHLPKGHILARVKRHTVKVFIAHLYQAMYYYEYGQESPELYVQKYLDHDGVIYPEVDFKQFM